MPAFRFNPLAFFLTASLPLSAMSAETTGLSLADDLFQRRNYFDAVTEYKRFLYFHPLEDSLAGRVWFRIGLCFRNSREWESALAAFNKVQSGPDSAILGEQSRFQSALVQLAHGSIGEAEFEFARLRKFSPDSAVRIKSVFFQGMCQVRRYAWKEARYSFQYYAQLSGNSLTPRLDSLLNVAAHKKWKSPETARRLSTFLPGAGQTYAGFPIEGLYALALNSVTAGFSVYFLLEGKIAEGLILGIVWERFYAGNRQKSGQLAARVTEAAEHAILEQILGEAGIATLQRNPL